MMRLLGKRIALLDCLVHQQDIRRSLGRPRAIPPERLAAVAEILRHHRIGAGGIVRARGLRFVATDTGWFRFSNSDARTYRGIAALIDCGAQPAELYERLYHIDSPARVKLAQQLGYNATSVWPNRLPPLSHFSLGEVAW